MLSSCLSHGTLQKPLADQWGAARCCLRNCKSPFPGLCDVSDARMTPQESNRCPQTEELRYVTWQGWLCVPFLNGHSLWAHPHFETSYDKSYEPYCWFVDIALYPNVVPMYPNVPSCFSIPCWWNSQSEAFYWPRADIFGKPRDPSNLSLAGSLL